MSSFGVKVIMVSGTPLWKTIVTVQKSTFSVCVILALLFPVFSSECSEATPSPGTCVSASNPHENDDTVSSSSAIKCDFTDNGDNSLCFYRQGCRDQRMTNWTATNGFATSLSTFGCANTYSVLESPWLNFSAVSCVQFSFLTKSPSDLDVFFDVKGGQIETVENRTKNNHGYNQAYSRQFTVHSLVGKILFRAYGGGSSGSAELKVYNVSLKESACSGQVWSVISTVSPATGGDRNPQNGDMVDDGPRTGVVVGAVIAVVVVITVIIVVVIIWRRRGPKSNTGGYKDTENDISTVKTGGVATRKAEGNDGNDYTAIRKSHFALATPSPEEDYVEIDDVTSPTKIESRDADVRAHDTAKIRTRDDADIKRYDVPKVTTRDADNTPYDPAKIRTRDDADIKHYDVPKVTTRDADNTPNDLAKITTHDDDIDPYDHVEDGAPGKGRNSGGHDHKRFQLHDTPHQKPLPSEKVVDGDYSEIDGPQDITRSDVSDSYSRVQKTNKKPGSPDPKDDYSVANKKGKKPEVATKFEQPEGDYNRIRLAGSRPVASNTPRDAPSDPYNRIGKVPSHDDVGNGGESTKAEGDQVQDDYNTLSFDEARKMSAKTTERGTSHKAYDRVQTDPYSKTQVGKRNVVIDSDYDHVQK